MSRTLQGKTIFITGASRGIGKEIALRAARDGANIVIAAKTAEPQSGLPGTIYTAAEEIKAAGGKALACIVDVRFEDQVLAAVSASEKAFGGIDILVNNASALSLTATPETTMKRYDLMHQVNGRGTFLCSKTCYPLLVKAENPHILMIAPPLSMESRWFAPHVAYTMAKYTMSMCVLGMSAEFAPAGIAVNALWPRTIIATSAIRKLHDSDQIWPRSRKPEIMANAAYAILTRDSRSFTGNFCIDEDVLREQGIESFDQYAVEPGMNLVPDLFI